MPQTQMAKEKEILEKRKMIQNLREKALETTVRFLRETLVTKKDADPASAIPTISEEFEGFNFSAEQENTPLRNYLKDILNQLNNPDSDTCQRLAEGIEWIEPPNPLWLMARSKDSNYNADCFYLPRVIYLYKILIS